MRGLLRGLVKVQQNGLCAGFVILETFRRYMVNRLEENYENNVDVKQMTCGYSRCLQQLLDLLYSILTHSVVESNRDEFLDKLRQYDVDCVGGVDEVRCLAMLSRLTLTSFCFADTRALRENWEHMRILQGVSCENSNYFRNQM